MSRYIFHPCIGYTVVGRLVAAAKGHDVDFSGWNDLIARLPNAHLLQTTEWAKVRQQYGWQPLPQTWKNGSGRVTGAAMVLQRTVSPLKLKILYAPRGPMVDWFDAAERTRALAALEALARSQKAIFIKIDPEILVGTGAVGSPEEKTCQNGLDLQEELAQRGWLFSKEQVQFRNTMVVDLTEPEESWLARLKQKARYNLRLGEKKGVKVRTGSLADLDMLYQMYAETSVRDDFLIRSKEYYLALWRTFYEAGLLEPLIAEVDGAAVAGIMVFIFARRAWYLQGMSRDVHREKMPNYLLQWAAMRRARDHGCQAYDLWGAPDQFDTSDHLWGVYRFKESLGGKVVRTVGAWDFPVNSTMYVLYTRLFPKLLAIMRRRGRQQTRQEVSG